MFDKIIKNDGHMAYTILLLICPQTESFREIFQYNQTEKQYFIVKFFVYINSKLIKLKIIRTGCNL